MKSVFGMTRLTKRRRFGIYLKERGASTSHHPFALSMGSNMRATSQSQYLHFSSLPVQDTPAMFGGSCPRMFKNSKQLVIICNNTCSQLCFTTHAMLLSSGVALLSQTYLKRSWSTVSGLEICANCRKIKSFFCLFCIVL